MMDWVRNLSKNGKPTSQWHILHSYRVGERDDDSGALTACGHMFGNPSMKPPPNNRFSRCSNCSSLRWALENTTAVPDELVIR